MGVVAVLSASAFWSFGGVLGKSTGASGIVLSFWRLWIASAVMFVYTRLRGGAPTRVDLRASWVAGVLFGLNLCAFFITLQHTTIAVALIIGALSPVVALPIAVQFAESVENSKRTAVRSGLPPPRFQVTEVRFAAATMICVAGVAEASRARFRRG